MTPPAFLHGAMLTIALVSELLAQAATPQAAVEEARRQVAAVLVPQLEQLVQTCERKKLLRERDQIASQILHFDPDNAAARKTLKFKRGTDGRWQQDPNYLEPKDASEKELPALTKDWQAAIASSRERLHELLAQAPRDIA